MWNSCCINFTLGSVWMDDVGQFLFIFLLLFFSFSLIFVHMIDWKSLSMLLHTPLDFIHSLSLFPAFKPSGFGGCHCFYVFVPSHFLFWRWWMTAFCILTSVYDLGSNLLFQIIILEILIFLVIDVLWYDCCLLIIHFQVLNHSINCDGIHIL